MSYPVLYCIQKWCKNYRRRCLINLLENLSILCSPFILILRVLNFQLSVYGKASNQISHVFSWSHWCKHPYLKPLISLLISFESTNRWRWAMAILWISKDDRGIKWKSGRAHSRAFQSHSMLIMSNVKIKLTNWVTDTSLFLLKSFFIVL